MSRELAEILDPRTGVYPDNTRNDWVFLAFSGDEKRELGRCAMGINPQARIEWERETARRLIKAEQGAAGADPRGQRAVSLGFQSLPSWAYLTGPCPLRITHDEGEQ